MIGLIDGDSFLYRAGFSVEKTRYLVERMEDGKPSFTPVTDGRTANRVKDGIVWSRKDLGSLEDAISILRGMLDRAVDRSGVATSFIYLSPLGPTFRDRISTVRRYKEGRNRVRPYFYSDLREYLTSNRKAIVAYDEEADDMISWVARDLRRQGKDYCIIGIDKDLVQIPGLHYDWQYDEVLDVTDDEARVWYWTQVLAGDQTDGVLGCWKFGYSKAKSFVHSCTGLSDEEVWPKVVKRYRLSQGLDGCPYAGFDAEEVALENARLVRLRQISLEPLWTPNITKDETVKEKKSHGRRRRSDLDRNMSDSAQVASGKEQKETETT